MGLFDGLLGGQGGLTTTTTNNTSTAVNPAQVGGWVTINPAQQHNALRNDPRMWSQQPPLTPYGETMELKERIKELEYIVQRVVDNYEELQTQYKALQDITKAGEGK